MPRAPNRRSTRTPRVRGLTRAARHAPIVPRSPRQSALVASRDPVFVTFEHVGSIAACNRQETHHEQLGDGHFWT